jgi:hypothetical protein
MALEMRSAVVGLVFLLKQMEDLKALIDWLDHLLYLSKQVLMVAATETEASPKMSKSSAKRRW